MHLFQSFWWGGALSPYEASCLRSFIDCGYQFDLFTYTADLVAPTGVRIRPASEVLDESEFFVYETEPNRGSPSAFSNLFRYRLLAERGGWWVDTDIVCLSTTIPNVSEFFARHDEALANCGVLRFPPNHPFMIRCFERAKLAGRAIVWGDTGPKLFSSVIKEAGAWGEAAPAHLSEAIPPQMALAPLKASMVDVCRSLTSESWFVHLWNSSLCTNGIDKTLRPPRHSFLRGLFDRHPVEGWRGELLSPVVLPYDTLA